MKKSIISIALSATLATSALVSTQAFAVEGLSANAAVTNNYLWRGLEQTLGAAAVSGGIDYAHESGAYVGTWASNASWGDMQTELDLYFGYAGDINESVSYDVGFIYWAYLDSAEAENDYSEVYANMSVGGFTFGLAVLAYTTAGGDTGKFGDSLYASIDYAYELESGAEVGFHIGDYSGDFVESGYNGENIIDFNVSISKDGFTFGVSKSDVDTYLGADDAKFFVSYGVDFDL